MAAPPEPSVSVAKLARKVASSMSGPLSRSIGLHDGLALERELQQRLFEGEDAREGLAAYVGKRAAVFTGK